MDRGRRRRCSAGTVARCLCAAGASRRRPSCCTSSRNRRVRVPEPSDFSLSRERRSNQHSAANERASSLAERFERQMAVDRSTCSRLISRRSPVRAGHRPSSLGDPFELCSPDWSYFCTDSLSWSGDRAAIAPLLSRSRAGTPCRVPSRCCSAQASCAGSRRRRRPRSSRGRSRTPTRARAAVRGSEPDPDAASVPRAS
jgi:hypothetical protein